MYHEYGVAGGKGVGRYAIRLLKSILKIDLTSTRLGHITSHGAMPPPSFIGGKCQGQSRIVDSTGVLTFRSGQNAAPTVCFQVKTSH